MADYSPRFDMKRFTKALTYTSNLHAQQIRKGSDLPYISHLLGVASIAMEYGGGEDECIAALLHDAAEDQGVTFDAIRLKFGKRVADIVEACTDACAEPGARKPDWEQRKAEYIAHLQVASESAKLISAADKLHNARAILADHRANGDKVFERFNKSKYATLWYYRTLASTFRRVLPGHLSDELGRTVNTLEKEAREKDNSQASETRKAVYVELDTVLSGILAKMAAQSEKRDGKKGAERNHHHSEVSALSSS